MEQNNSKELWESVSERLARQEWTAALSGLQDLQDLNPNDPVVFYNKAIVLSRLGRQEEALQNIRHALEFKPDYTLAQQALKILESSLPNPPTPAPTVSPTPTQSPTIQDNLDIETTMQPGRSNIPSSPPIQKPVSSTPLGDLDIETTMARPKAPSQTPKSQPTPQPAPQPVQSQPPVDGQSTLPIGYILDDKFVITKILGKGGLGIVYKATERDTGVEFAVKVLTPELFNDAMARKDLKTEVANAQRLTHQNLLKINYLAEAGPITYIVMECIDGENLEEYRVRKGGKINMDDFRKIAPQVLSALEYLHEKGLVHCDVKPQNIMITPGGEVKITDYGIARTIKEQLARESVTQMSAGTLAYMAPEQIRGDNVCDRRADLYSVGIMFYRLVTGEFPFDTKDREAIIKWHIDDKHTIHGTGSGELDGIIGKSLCVVLAGRYQTCRVMLDDLINTGFLKDTNQTPATIAAPTVEATHIENLLQLTRLTRQLMMKRPWELLFAVFSGYPAVNKKRDGSYALIKGGQGIETLNLIFGKKVYPVEELANEISAIKSKGVALDHRLQHNIEILLIEAEELHSKLLSANVYRGIAIGMSILSFIVLPLIPFTILFWPFGIFVVLGLWCKVKQRKLVDDIVFYLKKSQGADMY